MPPVPVFCVRADDARRRPPARPRRGRYAAAKTYAETLGMRVLEATPELTPVR